MAMFCRDAMIVLVRFGFLEIIATPPPYFCLVETFKKPFSLQIM
jgi:hypothetical protein